MPSKAVLRELRSVCQSPAFLKSAEAVRLLRYLVEAEQAGQSEKLREVLIGCGLYGRVASYDPKLDAVVRVNATRLRARLEEHYAEHPDWTVRIVLPKGSYVPVYEHREAAEPEVPAPVEMPTLPPVIVPAAFAEQPVFMRRNGLAAAVCLGLLCVTAGWMFWKARPQQAARGALWVALPFSRMGGVEQFAEFAPDGRSVVFAWARSEREPPALYVQEVESDVPRRVTGLERAEVRAAWSPDGKRLAFVHPDGNGLNHMMVRTLADGSEMEVAALPSRPPWLCGVPKLSWSGDGGTLYTAAPGAEGRCGIVAIDLASRGVRVLTQSPPVTLGDVEGTVSPDGQMVAFLRTVSYGVVDVYLVGARGGMERRLTSDNREIMGLAWKPGSQALVLGARGKDGTVRLVERDVKGGPARLLTDGTAPAAFPSVASSAERIVFTSYRSTANIEQVAGGAVTELVADLSLKAMPQLSPDGRRLTYTSDRTGFAEVWISDADGRNGMRLTHTQGTGAQSPKWFPEGKTVLFECRDLQYSQICAMPVTGEGGMTRLTTWRSDQVFPSLSRDGRFLYFMSNRTGRLEAYRQALPQGEPVQLTSGGAVRVAESWDGRTVYVETGKDDVGFLIVPVEQGRVETAELTDANRAFARPALRSRGMSAWNAGPGGLIFCRLAGGHSELVEVDDRTGGQHLLQQIAGSEEVDDFSVGPDGRTVVYALRPRRSAELDLLTTREAMKAVGGR